MFKDEDISMHKEALGPLDPVLYQDLSPSTLWAAAPVHRKAVVHGFDACEWTRMFVAPSRTPVVFCLKGKKTNPCTLPEQAVTTNITVLTG